MAENGYKDPTKEMLGDGRAVADVMRGRGPRGVRGVIVSPAGVDGKSISFDPHDKKNLAINVVSPNGSTLQSLHLADFTKDAIQAAVDAAKSKIPGGDIDSIRERAAMAFEELAAFSGSGVVKKSAAQPLATQIKPPPVPAAQPTSAEIDRSYSPMAAFGLKKSAAPKPVNIPEPARRQINSGPPTKLLYFEKEGIGTVPAFFHEVIVEISAEDAGVGFIVLVYDLGFDQAAARWFPPADDPYKRPWAVQVQNEPWLYLVHTTGFQYVYDNREFCVLNVEKAVNAGEQ
jgi:hypothetical protein